MLCQSNINYGRVNGYGGWSDCKSDAGWFEWVRLPLRPLREVAQ